MSGIPAFDQPLEFEVIEGEVVLTGPDGLCASLTLQAAQESERRLRAALDSVDGSASDSPT